MELTLTLTQTQTLTLTLTRSVLELETCADLKREVAPGARLKPVQKGRFQKLLAELTRRLGLGIGINPNPNPNPYLTLTLTLT